MGKKIKMKNKKRFKSASAKKHSSHDDEPDTATLSSPETAGLNINRGPNIKIYDEDGVKIGQD